MKNLKGFDLLLDLFISFLRVSPVSFGGGYAMLPLIEREIVTKRKWLTSGEMSNVFAIAGAAPGGIGVNAATLVGYRLAGMIGATVAVIGMTLPTFVIMIALVILYNGFSEYAAVRGALMGVQIGVVALIMYAAMRMGKTAFVDGVTLVSGLGAIVVLLFTDIHPIWLIPIGAVIGMGVYPAMFARKNKKPPDEMREFFHGDGI
ncbi:MAG TPA: chromate transporter [Bacilli bacterium]